jgi:hypothetical protein
LDTLAGFANSGLMIPEQVWDRKEFGLGQGTGSATPLAWSMAQFVRLAISIEKGRNVEMPKVVWERYAGFHAKTQSSRKAQRRVKVLCLFANPLRFCVKPFLRDEC